MAAPAADTGAVIASQGVVLRLPGRGQTEYSLDDVLGGYLWTALNPDGVRVVDTTPQVMAAIHREKKLSDEGRLGTKFTFRPLEANHFLHGYVTIGTGGKAFVELRIVDASGVVVAIASARGNARHLRDLLVKAVNDVSARAAPQLSPPSGTTGSGSTSGSATYGLDVSLDYRDYQATEGGLTRDLGVGRGHVIVTGPDGVQYPVGCISEPGCGGSGHWDFPAGATVTLQAVADRDSTFGGWSVAGDVCNGGGVCTLKLTATTSVIAHFEAKVFVLTINNKNPDHGTVQSLYPGAAIIGIDCGEGQTRCRAVERAYADFTLSITSLRGNGAPQNYWIGSVDGCPDLQYNGTPPTDAAQCNYRTTESAQPLTVDWVPQSP
jgi:hypothetical protein